MAFTEGEPPTPYGINAGGRILGQVRVTPLPIPREGTNSSPGSPTPFSAADEMIEHYYVTVGRGSAFLPNFAPDRRVLMTDEVLSHARAFGDRVRSLNEAAIAFLAAPQPHRC